MANRQLTELESTISRALAQTGLQKELDLCTQLPYGKETLPSSVYLNLKDHSPRVLQDLIENYVLVQDAPPQSTSSKVAYSGTSVDACIRKAMTKLNVQQETALCKYIPYDNGHIHHFTFLHLKSKNPVQLRNLIQKHILDVNPKRRSPKPRKRSTPQSSTHTPEHNTDDLQSVIEQAMEREALRLEHEEDLCRYLPKDNSFLHPMAFRRLKQKNPQYLTSLIQKYVIEPEAPQKLLWRRRTSVPPEKLQPHDVGEDNKHLSACNDLLTSDELLISLDNTLRLSRMDRKYCTPRHDVTSNLCSTDFRNIFFEVQLSLLEKVLNRKVDYDLWNSFVHLAALSSTKNFSICTEEHHWSWRLAFQNREALLLCRTSIV